VIYDKVSIKEMVREYGQQGIDEIISDLNPKMRGKNIQCPYPGHEDKNPSATVLDNCIFCHSCGLKYDIVNHYEIHHSLSKLEAISKLKKNLGYDFEITKENVKKRVQEEQKDLDDITDLKAIFEFREIDFKVVTDHKISNHSKSKNGRKYEIIGLEYKDKNGEFSSYQKIDVNTLKQKMQPKKNLLYNYEKIEDSEDVIICFDVIDYLTLKSKGFDNVCAKSTKGNGFVANYYDQLKKHKTITLVFGNSVSSSTFQDIVKRIGIETVKYNRLAEYKTVNHAIVAGENAEDIVKNAKFVGIKSIKKLEDITFENAKQRQMRFGSRSGAMVGIDWLLDGVRTSTLTTIVGRDNEGKTSFVQQVMLNLLEQKVPIFLYDGESNEATLKRKLYRKLIGNDEKALETKKINIRPIKYPKKTVEEAIQKWHENRLIIKTNGNNQNIFEDMKIAYRRYGTKVYVIDNLMSLLETDAANKYVDQSNIVEKLKQFAKALRVHIILIVHPHKMEENKLISKLNISGTKEISDKSDNIISIMRWFDKYERFDNLDLDERVTTIAEVLKNREFGEYGKFYFMFNKNTEKFDELRGNEILTNEYSWKEELKNLSIDTETYEKIKVKDKYKNECPF